MAVMPLSAVSNGDASDTFPVGLAIDYTATKDLPPVSDDEKRVPAVPIMWILTTDGCLLGYHIYNTREMRSGGRCSKMVDQVRKLPAAPEINASSRPASVASLSRSSSPTFASNPFGQPRSLAGGFGASTGSAPAFGKPSAISPPRGTMGLTTAGIKNQPVFGSSAKLGPSSPTRSGGFGGFGGFGVAAPDGKSIFDAPSSGPSVFDTTASSSRSPPFGPAKPFGAGAAEPAKPASKEPVSSFGASTSFAPTFGKPSTISPPRRSMGLTTVGIKNQPVFGSSAKLGPSSPTRSGGFGGFGGFGVAAPDGKSIFDAPSSGPSVFDTTASSSRSPPFGPAKPFGASAAEPAKPASKEPAFSHGPFGKPADPKADVGDLMAGFGSMGASGSQSSSLFGAAAEKQQQTASTASAKPTSGAFGGFTSASKTSAALTKNKISPGAKSPPELAKSPAEIAREKKQQQEEEQKLKEQKLKEQKEREEKERKEKERVEALRRKMEAEAQDLLNRQYISTCNSFDADLKALRS
ncbi:hypothetical protein LPJ56_005524, partial [Coemansia sp. RSA 2599]